MLPKSCSRFILTPPEADGAGLLAVEAKVITIFVRDIISCHVFEQFLTSDTEADSFLYKTVAVA